MSSRIVLAALLVLLTACKATVTTSTSQGAAGAAGAQAGQGGAGAGQAGAGQAGASQAGAAGSGEAGAGAGGEGGAGDAGEGGAGGEAGSAGGEAGGGAGGEVGGAGAGGEAGAAGAPEDLAKVREWVETVALGPEFGGNGKIVARWVKPIKLSVMKGDKAVRADMLELIPTLNEALTPAGAAISVVDDGDAGADLKVYFTSLSEFDSIGQENGFPYVQGNWGYFYTFWNGKREIQRAYVLIATDKLSGSTLRHFTFEEVTQSLGLSNDSPAFSDSIFYSSNGDGGSATELSALDRKLLSFFYTHVQPGFDKAKLGAAFDAHWK